MKFSIPALLSASALFGSALVSSSWIADAAGPEVIARQAHPAGTIVYDSELREFARLDSAHAGDPPNAAILLVESHAGAQVRMAVPQNALRVGQDNRLVLESFGGNNASASARVPGTRPRVLQL